MLKKNNLLLKVFLITISLNILTPADNDIPFGDILLHHVTNDSQERYIDLRIGYNGGWDEGEAYTDSNENEIWDKGEPFEDLPFIDLSITKHVILMWVIAALIIILALLGTAKYRNNKDALPTKFSGLFEILIEFIRKDLVIPNIGKNHANRWTPLIATFFIFILFANFLGLIPFLEFLPGGSGTITGNFSVTGALALVTFVAIIIAGSMKHGFIGHWKNMIPSGVPAPVLLILIPV